METGDDIENQSLDEHEYLATLREEGWKEIIKLKGDLKNLSRREERRWRQKAKEKWIKKVILVLPTSIE